MGASGQVAASQSVRLQVAAANPQQAKGPAEPKPQDTTQPVRPPDNSAKGCNGCQGDKGCCTTRMSEKDFAEFEKVKGSIDKFLGSDYLPSEGLNAEMKGFPLADLRSQVEKLSKDPAFREMLKNDQEARKEFMALKKFANDIVLVSNDQNLNKMKQVVQEIRENPEKAALFFKPEGALGLLEVSLPTVDHSTLIPQGNPIVSHDSGGGGGWERDSIQNGPDIKFGGIEIALKPLDSLALDKTIVLNLGRQSEADIVVLPFGKRAIDVPLPGVDHGPALSFSKGGELSKSMPKAPQPEVVSPQVDKTVRLSRPVDVQMLHQQDAVRVVVPSARNTLPSELPKNWEPLKKEGVTLKAAEVSVQKEIVQRLVMMSTLEFMSFHAPVTESRVAMTGKLSSDNKLVMATIDRPAVVTESSPTMSKANVVAVVTDHVAHAAPVVVAMPEVAQPVVARYGANSDVVAPAVTVNLASVAAPVAKMTVEVPMAMATVVVEPVLNASTGSQAVNQPVARSSLPAVPSTTAHIVKESVQSATPQVATVDQKDAGAPVLATRGVSDQAPVTQLVVEVKGSTVKGSSLVSTAASEMAVLIAESAPVKVVVSRGDARPATPVVTEKSVQLPQSMGKDVPVRSEARPQVAVLAGPVHVDTPEPVVVLVPVSHKGRPEPVRRARENGTYTTVAGARAEGDLRTDANVPPTTRMPVTLETQSVTPKVAMAPDRPVQETSTATTVMPRVETPQIPKLVETPVVVQPSILAATNFAANAARLSTVVPMSLTSQFINAPTLSQNLSWPQVRAELFQSFSQASLSIPMPVLTLLTQSFASLKPEVSLKLTETVLKLFVSLPPEGQVALGKVLAQFNAVTLSKVVALLEQISQKITPEVMNKLVQLLSKMSPAEVVKLLDGIVKLSQLLKPEILNEFVSHLSQMDPKDAQKFLEMALKLCVNLSEEEAGEMLKNLLLSSKLTGKLQESLSSATAGSQEVFRRRKMGLTTQEMREKIVEKRDIVLQLFRAILGASDSQNLEDVPN